MEINETAKMLYIILLDRARLSQKNEGWSDTVSYTHLNRIYVRVMIDILNLNYERGISIESMRFFFY